MTDRTEPLDVLPVLIDAPWGAGKSSLVAFLKADLDHQEQPTKDGRAVPGRDTRPWAAAPEVFDAWNGLWEGFAAMESLQLSVVARLDQGDGAFEWRIR